MKTDRIAGLLAVGLTLVACSPEELSRDPAPGAPAAAVDVTEDITAGKSVPAVKTVPPTKAVPPRRSAAEPEPEVDPDPQVGVELPEQPVRVPENPPAG